jgi:hypothetical protein
MPSSQPKLERYRRRPSQYIIAVQLKLDTDGLRFRKWGGEQRAKRGDWLVDNQGEVYTVEAQSFRKTYRRVSPGIYLKKTPVWARRANESGSIKTKEGATRYRKGDYLVFNLRNSSDGYAMPAAKFRSLYMKESRGKAARLIPSAT